ncbi:transmembrane protein 165-like [Physella acuta]|uniref:transmembrane protein 165-like n=1 Tax=Physella acuta TaxID=109671 RepID=UPI0027DCA2FB|nr:transmembrane protein 165-like [Physella acuta]XP_059178427.1 transmembrane protein 165-like [Physella acuta]XP_059178428.1 transmembrane protein 165-like [Physella acuta]
MDTESTFINGFMRSMSVIIVSELGDNTFFLAAIMAMKHSRLAVLMGNLAAQIFMTTFSTAIGYAATMIPGAVTHFISSALFGLFGTKMLKEALHMSTNKAAEEYQEAQDVLKEDERKKKQNDTVMFLKGIVSPVFLQSFTLTFMAEWGDRSQITTIILAVKENLCGVLLGTFIGNALCTGLAVLGGGLIAKRISVRTVTVLGGLLFLFFAVSSLLTEPEE